MEEEDQGFIRGDNETCVFKHKTRELTVLLYVDDCLIDGDQEDIEWFLSVLSNRFTCKEPEWLTPDTPLDYLGMELTMDDDRIYLSMESYILDMIKHLELEQGRQAHTPIAGPISNTDPKLNPSERKWFMTALGCVGWLVNTARPDVAYAHSRIAQHMANPTRSALDAAKRMCRYLRDHANLTLSAPIWEIDNTLCVLSDDHTETDDQVWAFFCDSDFAGNSEEQNARRSQNGIIAIENGAPVWWSSKVSSVAFAHPQVGESHADISSGAVEVYAAGNAVNDFLHLSYAVEESGMTFPLPIRLQIDNAAAEAFIKRTAAKSRMKHIDCRQEWLKVLRNKEICVPVHVDSAENIADIFTKILDRNTFERLLQWIMAPRPDSRSCQ